MSSQPASNTAAGGSADFYDDYDAFLQRVVREYYGRGWSSRRGNFVALLIASGQMTSMAKESVVEGSGLKKAAIGAASVVALRLAWRYFLAGPLGILVGVAALGSAIAYLTRHQREVTAKIGPYRSLVAETRTRFEEIQGGYRAGRYDQAGRNLMVDGLLQQMLGQIDNTEAPTT